MIGLKLKSPKHGEGQIVDARKVKSKPLYIVLYNDGTFGSYYRERLVGEFEFLDYAALPQGYPKIARLNTPEIRAKANAYSSFKQGLMIAQHEAYAKPQDNVDSRPYHVIHVDARLKIIKREVKK